MEPSGKCINETEERKKKVKFILCKLIIDQKADDVSEKVDVVMAKMDTR